MIDAPGIGPRRRLLRAAPAAALGATVASSALTGCAHSGAPSASAESALSSTPGAATSPDAWRALDGAQVRAGGPNLARYTDASGAIPSASTGSWWQVRHSVDGFSRLGDILPASVSRAASQPQALRRAISEPSFDYTGTRNAGSLPWQSYFDRNPVTGLMVLRQGEVLIERYQYGRTPGHRFTSFSMAKTLVAAMMGLAVQDGVIRSVDDPAERYARGLSGTEYGRTPIKALLTMTSGVRFREDYDGQDDSARLSRAVVGRQSAGGADVVRPFNDRIASPGDRWYYASAETFVLALVLREALNRPLAEYFSERIWQPIGAQTDALWLTDPSGLEAGYMGFNATLRDYGRLALMLADGGRAHTAGVTRQVLPAAWLQEMTRAQVSSARTGRFFGYGYQTWVFPANDGSFALQGVRGQVIYVNPARQLALVHTAVRPDARDPGGAEATALWRGLLSRA
jgi:CubicO group peptidase (beta-lactamase class C family)